MQDLASGSWPDLSQEPTRVLLLRHGQTAWNAEQRIQGQLDVPLNAVGRWQAQRLAETLADEDISVLYSSDLQRTRQTAAPLALALGLDVSLHAGLRERGFGSFEGRTYKEIDAAWPEHATLWRQRDLHYQPGGGEALITFNARSVSAVLGLVSAHPGQTVAIVSHGGVLDCLYRAAVRIDLQAPRTWQIDNAVINRLLWTPQGFSLVGWSDAGHLEVVAGP
jgi:2,3-bisphosphoglycerate-dependent phosphoglycerate mutase